MVWAEVASRLCFNHGRKWGRRYQNSISKHFNRVISSVQSRSHQQDMQPRQTTLFAHRSGTPFPPQSLAGVPPYSVHASAGVWSLAPTRSRGQTYL